MSTKRALCKGDAQGDGAELLCEETGGPVHTHKKRVPGGKLKGPLFLCIPWGEWHMVINGLQVIKALWPLSSERKAKRQRRSPSESKQTELRRLGSRRSAGLELTQKLCFLRAVILMARLDSPTSNKRTKTLPCAVHRTEALGQACCLDTTWQRGGFLSLSLIPTPEHPPRVHYSWCCSMGSIKGSPFGT